MLYNHTLLTFLKLCKFLKETLLRLKCKLFSLKVTCKHPHITTHTHNRLVQYVAENEPDDPLINPPDQNPFKDKAKCVML